MHSYITDSSERRYVPLCLAGLSVLLSWALYSSLTTLQVVLPWWIDAPSVAGFYGGLYKLFDCYCWRWKALRAIGIVKVPLLDGHWSGYVISSHDDHQQKHPVSVQIRQNWTQMQITLKGHFSRSFSFLAAVLTDAPEGIVLDYEYQNEPIPDATETMQMHHGTARLTISLPRVMQGYYYTGRGRGNHGYIYLSR